MTRRWGLASVAVAGMTAALLAVAAMPAAAQTVLCNGLEPTITGTPGDDRIEGTSNRDVIVALEGRDIIFGRGGNDIICGGPGGDVIKGGTGNDTMIGGGGNDRLIGGIGKDTIEGGNGKDRIFAGGGGDVIKGGSSSDRVSGGNGIDRCNLDAADRFDACERGDVYAISGTGSGTFPFAVPAGHAFVRWPEGGQQGLQTGDAGGFVGQIVSTGSPTFSVSLGGAQGLGGGGATFEVDQSRRLLVATPGGDAIDSVTIDGLGGGDAWDLTIFGPDVTATVPGDGIVSGNGAGVFALGAAGPGTLLDIGVGGNNEPTDVFVALLGPNAPPRVLVADRFESPQLFLAFTGEVPAGSWTHIAVESSGAVSLVDLVEFIVTFTAL